MGKTLIDGLQASRVHVKLFPDRETDAGDKTFVAMQIGGAVFCRTATKPCHRIDGRPTPNSTSSRFEPFHARLLHRCQKIDIEDC
jgi:hypothetical protein